MAEHLDYLKLRAAMESVGDVAINTVVQDALKRKKQRTAKTTPAVEAVAAVPKPKDQPITSEKVSAVDGIIEIPAKAPPAVEELPSVIIEEGAPSAAGEETRRVEERGAPTVEARPIPSEETPTLGDIEVIGAPSLEPEIVPADQGELPGETAEPEVPPFFAPPDEADRRRAETQRIGRALEEVAYAANKVRRVEHTVTALKRELERFIEGGQLKELDERERQEYDSLRAALARRAPQEVLQLPGLTDEERTALTKIKGELARAREELELAKQGALNVGATQEQVDAKIPSAEAQIEPTERPAGIVEQPPTPQPGETTEQYLEKWALWKDALASGAKAVPKMAWGVVSTLLGVRLAQTGISFGLERWKRRKEKKAFAALARVLEGSLRQVPRTQEYPQVPEAEYEVEFEIFIKTMQALETRLDILVSAGKLKSEDREGLLVKIREAVGQAQQQEQSAQATLNKEVEHILHDYFQTKVSKVELGKQTMNTAFLLAGVQTARALGYGAFTALGRAVRARKEYEQKIKLEGRPADFWERERAVLQNLVPQAVAEYAQGATGIWADLFTGRRVSRSEWAQKKMAFGKALSTTFIFAGMAKVTHAEMTETGYSVSEQIDRVLNVVEKHGLGAAIANNWLHNIEQLPGGKHLVRFFGREGNLEVVEHPEGLVKRTPPPEAPATPPKTEVELKAESETNFFKANPAYQRLEALSGGKIDVVPHTDGHVSIEVTLGKEGYAHIQQALRDIVVLEKAAGAQAFGTLEATQVENAVANLKLLLEGKDLRFIDADKLDGVAHITAGKLVIDDASKFHEFLQNDILKHAADKITAENLARYDEAVATVNNTSDANWQKDVNVGTGVENASAAGYVKVNIDHEFVHKAEIDMAQHGGAGFTEAAGIKVQVDPRDVDDENNYTMRAADTGQAIPVVDGHVDIIITKVGDHQYVHDLPQAVKLGHAYAEDTLGKALTTAHDTALKEAGAGAPPESTELAAGALPKTFPELLKIPVADGGLVAADGTVHLGAVKFKPEWLDKIDEKGAEAFAKDPISVAKIPVWRRFSEEAHAIRALANTIEAHPDSGTVANYIVKHLNDLDRWMRSAPRELGEITDIGGV